MVVITMPSTPSLITKLRQDYPDIQFAPGDCFRWDPQQRIIFYGDTTDSASLIHELAHHLLGHTDYSRDINLLKMERDAWEIASNRLADRYKVPLDDDFIQDSLDTYRDWLHARSTCPVCKATGIQTARRHYACVACMTKWRVNEARSCALRRYPVTHEK